MGDITSALDKNEVCASVFTELSTAFDTVDHGLLTQRLVDIGIGEKAVGWFNNYFRNQTQSIKADGFISERIELEKEFLRDLYTDQSCLHFRLTTWALVLINTMLITSSST